jgi:deoxycytidylate deaminase
MVRFVVFEDENTIKTSSEKQYSFFKRAMNVALKSQCINHRHGCVIVKDDEIISEGYNHRQYHLYHKMSVHAEVDALSKLKHNKKIMSTCDLYVVRIGGDSMGNPLKYSRPCKDCEKAIKKSGIKRVYYSTNLEFEEIMEREGSDHSCSSSESSCKS